MPLAKPILYFIFLAITVTASAQSHQVGIAGGYTYSFLASNSFANVYPVNRAPVSLNYSYLLRDRFMFGTGIGYDPRGFIFKSLVNNGSMILEDTNRYDHKTNLNYLVVPIFVGYQSKKRLHIEFKAGVLGGLLVRAKTIKPLANKSGMYDRDTTINIKADVHKTDLGYFAEAGLGYRMNSKFSALFSFRFMNGLSNVPKRKFYDYFEHIYYEGSENKNGYISFLLELRYRFHCK